MDLNHLYSQHQLSLMQAAGATSPLDRTRHLAAAGLAASRIRTYQLAKGAAAASGWLRNVERSFDPGLGACP
jgi:hypothetical protein